MGHTFRRNSDYGCKNDYRKRNDRKLKKLNKRLRKITDQKQIINPPPLREGSEFV